MDANFSVDIPQPQPAQRFLNRARLSAYAGTLIVTVEVVYLFAGAWIAWRQFGQPIGFDFGTFWAAGRLSLEGHSVLAWSNDAIVRTVHQVAPHALGPGPWFYPPSFLVLVKPLALLPLPIASLTFMLGTGAAYFVLLRKILPMRGAMVWIFAFPGFWLNFAQGQNANLTASLALGGLLLLRERREIAAGICIGMLSIKPHLAILFPLALACGGMWRAFVAAALTAVLTTAASIAILGFAVVPAFFQALSLANHYVAHGNLPWSQMASLFVTLRSLHVPIGVAYAAQAGLAVAAALTVVWVWRTTREFDVRAIALVAGTFLVSPYLYNYDTAWLGIPLALLAARGLRDGWLRGERVLLAIAFFYGPCGDSFAHGFGPLVFTLLLAAAVRRALQRPSSSTPPLAASAAEREPIASAGSTVT